MLSVAEALERITSAFIRLPAEWIPLEAGGGRVLAADLEAQRDQPPAAVSAMDGYAVRAADLESGRAELEVIDEAPAGRPFAAPVGPGQTVRIFTGGLLPDGADAIAIQENATREGERVILEGAVPRGYYVRHVGLDFARGERLLEAGTLLGARHLGLAAAAGYSHLPAMRRPRIGIASTGDELRRPAAVQQPWEIASSNTVLLAAAVESWGGVALDLGLVPDRREAFAELARNAAGLDAIVTSGGASVGEHDLVQAALGEHELRLDFWKIAMRPGKPLIFGRLDRVPLLGLPGNPVSAGVCALVFLRPAMMRLAGRPEALPLEKARLGRDLPANGEREEFMRARLAEDPSGPPLVYPAERQDSSMLATLARADALVRRPPHAPAASSGDMVDVVPLTRVAGF